MDKLRCFSNSSERLSDEKARTDTLLLLLSTVSLLLNCPARGRERNHGAMKYGYRMCSKGLPLQPCMHLSCGYSRRLTGPSEGKKWGRMLHGVNRGIVSQGPLIKGRIRWESKHGCALESINYHLN